MNGHSGGAPASDRDASNEKLRAREAELTALSRHLFLVAEEEKGELARELHDVFGSNLTAINMDLNWIARRLPEDRADLRDRLQRALRMLGETVAIKQNVIDRLRPSQLDTLGLAVALRSHCRELSERTSIVCEVHAPEDLDGLDRNVAIALYRFAQDALAHMEKRDDECSIEMDLAADVRGVRLRIHDKGKCLARAANAAQAGGNLVAMKERVRAVGGTLEVSIADEGAILEAFVPTAK
jgi:signal transduction histidine kinase